MVVATGDVDRLARSVACTQVTANHDPIPSERGVGGAAWCDAAGTPVLHHVIDLPANTTEAAQQVRRGTWVPHAAATC